MILDTKTGELTEGSYFRKTYWLTKTQKEILTILSDNEGHTWEELYDKLQLNPTQFRTHLCRLRKRIKNLTIKTQKSQGIKLKDIVVLK